jgi:deoxyadenosine/deoxycytidine kinase
MIQLSITLKRILQGERAGATTIFLSGLPGTGKTTVANLLKASLGATLIPEFIDEIPDWVIRTRPASPDDEKIRAQSWALEQHARKNELIVQAEAIPVVVDRTWVDTLLYAAAYGETTYRTILGKAEEIEWTKGHYVLLTASPPTIRDRLVARGAIGGSDWHSSWSDFVETLHQVAPLIAEGTLLQLIDTTTIEAAGVCEAIVGPASSKSWPRNA